MSDIKHELTIDQQTYSMQSCLVSSLDYFGRSPTASSDTGYKFYSLIITRDDGKKHTLTFHQDSSVDDNLFSQILDLIGQSDITIDTKTKTFSVKLAGATALHKIPYLDLE